MATFTNQATLSYQGGQTSSNITTGQLLESLAVTKTAVNGTYVPGGAATHFSSTSSKRWITAITWPTNSSSGTSTPRM